MGFQAQAQAISCGDTYVVKRGDTLQQITNRAYGAGNSYAALYNANRARIGADPSLIEVGQRLDIPCIGASAQVPAPVAAITPAPAAAPAPAPAASQVVTPTPVALNTSTPPRKLRVVTATDYAPYLNQDQAEGGMLVEIVNTALSRVMSPDEYKIDWVNDWSAHVNPLIADGAYDISLAWFRPNCDVSEKLSADSQDRCRNLAWTDPLFEQIIGYYMRADDAAIPTQYSELFGRSVCRPKGYSQFMMEEHDIVEPNVTIVTPLGPTECFELLLAGKTDAVVLATTVADDALAGIGMREDVVEVPALATVSTLNGITSVNNPNKDQQLAALNEGLRQLREDGTWFEIVQRHLIAHMRKTTTN